MTEAMKFEKLSMIRTLSQGEIEGWRREISRHEGRPFDGEAAALAAREKQIKGGR